MNELARHEWVAIHILPHEGGVRSWPRHRFKRLTPSDVDDLMQDAYLHLCDEGSPVSRIGKAGPTAVFDVSLLEELPGRVPTLIVDDLTQDVSSHASA